MKYLFFFGASYVHGVGAVHGSWPDIFKGEAHARMYGPAPAGEACQVYELGVPGATSQHLLDRMGNELHSRVHDGTSKDDVYIVLHTGINDCKAIDRPDNFLMDAAAFRDIVQQIVDVARQYSAHVILLGLPLLDESRNNPKINPITGNESYFTNARVREFDDTLRQVSSEMGVVYVPLIERLPADWLEKYAYRDGLHPNDLGYQWIADQLRPVLAGALPDAGGAGDGGTA